MNRVAQLQFTGIFSPKITRVVGLVFFGVVGHFFHLTAAFVACGLFESASGGLIFGVRKIEKSPSYSDYTPIDVFLGG